MKKPRLRFCWHCGKQLYGNHHVELIIDEYPRILHKSCGKLFMVESKGEAGNAAINANRLDI